MKNLVSTKLVYLALGGLVSVGIGHSASAAGVEASSAYADTAVAAYDQQDMRTERIFARLHTAAVMEIEASKMALQQSQSTDVRTFAQLVIDQHTQSEQELMQLAASMNLEIREFVPKTAAEIRDQKEAKRMYAGLTHKRGLEFDRAFTTMNIVVHQKLQTWLQTQRARIDQTELTSFFDGQEDLIRQHLDGARAVKARL